MQEVMRIVLKYTVKPQNGMILNVDMVEPLYVNEVVVDIEEEVVVMHVVVIDMDVMCRDIKHEEVDKGQEGGREEGEGNGREFKCINDGIGDNDQERELLYVEQEERN